MKPGDRVVYVGPTALSGLRPLKVIGIVGVVRGKMSESDSYQVQWQDEGDALVVPASELAVMETA